MSDNKTRNEELEQFDTLIRSTLLEEGNNLRAEKAYPILTEAELSDIDTLSELKKQFGNDA